MRLLIVFIGLADVEIGLLNGMKERMLVPISLPV